MTYFPAELSVVFPEKNAATALPAVQAWACERWEGAQSTGRRTEMQDRSALLMLARPDHKGLEVAVVLDGVGGSSGGAVAASIGCEVFLSELVAAMVRLGNAEPATLLAQAVHAANRTVLAGGHRDRPRLGMASTVVTAALQGDNLTVVWAGDSRCGVCRKNRLAWLTTDHTGPCGGVREHLGKQDGLSVDACTLDLEPGDTVVLVTDGVYGPLDSDRIASVLDVSEEPASTNTAEQLVTCALEAGSRDNLTAIVYRHTLPAS